ncbi:NADH dehydrogenase subunit 5 [Staphylococcus auricularis]|uniref:NADH dehydrogenase subunit 5 n=1 Tax=Staphylococcus auricularis TaxID=29379 RepID=UPI003F7A20D1|nr:NADH dehydrogenase subunit 5 [Staphylococcus auricularis]
MVLVISIQLLFMLFLAALVLCILSSLILISPITSRNYIKVHLWLLALPPIIAVVGLFSTERPIITDFWQLDPLAWLLASFVLFIGLILQRFSFNYLKGDRNYKKYFVLFTFMTVIVSLAWMSNDMRIFIVCWGLTLFCLTRLLQLNQRWHVTKEAGKVTTSLFFIAWFALLIAIILLHILTDTWQITSVLAYVASQNMNGWLLQLILLLIVLGVLIPAAQWPFQRWLIESVLAPTPVSAIMHAGIVNAGGIILTRFSTLFNGGDIATVLLLLFATMSVLIGSGINLVHVDYKRQMVGSTISQMGFMLVQCGLGAYSAAIIHLILHGIFKATLFLKSGSALRHFEASSQMNKRTTYSWIIAGRVLAVAIAAIYWFTTSLGNYQLISAIILGWSLSVAWTQLVALGQGAIARVAGLCALIIVGAVYLFVHHVFEGWLSGGVTGDTQPPLLVVICIIGALMLGSIVTTRLAQHPSSKAFAILYLWLIHLGEPHMKTVEAHPHYLKYQLLRGEKKDES